jgi:hypothetical protein
MPKRWPLDPLPAVRGEKQAGTIICFVSALSTYLRKIVNEKLGQGVFDVIVYFVL